MRKLAGVESHARARTPSAVPIAGRALCSTALGVLAGATGSICQRVFCSGIERGRGMSRRLLHRADILASWESMALHALLLAVMRFWVCACCDAGAQRGGSLSACAVCRIIP